MFFYVYILKLHKYIKKSQNVVNTVFRIWYWRMGNMVGGCQEKQAPKIAKKLLKEKTTCNFSHSKGNCNNFWGVSVCVCENINIQLQN